MSFYPTWAADSRSITIDTVVNGEPVIARVDKRFELAALLCVWPCALAHFGQLKWPTPVSVPQAVGFGFVEGTKQQ